jgi:hypothetical protein
VLPAYLISLPLSVLWPNILLSLALTEWAAKHERSGVMQKKEDQKSAGLAHPSQVKETLAVKGEATPTAKTIAATAVPRHVSDLDIRVRAYQKWEAAGKPKGIDMQFWLQAERELKDGK